MSDKPNHELLVKFKIQMENFLPIALGITQSSHFTGAAALECPVNPATYPFCLSKYPTNGGTVCQFPDDHARTLYRGKFYISLYVRNSVKGTFKFKSPIRSISDSTLYSTREEANLEVLTHRCMIEGFEKRGEEWFVPSSSPSVKFTKASFYQEVAAIETNIKSMRMAIEEKAAFILNLESQLCNERSSLAAIRASLLQAEAASVSASAFTPNNEQANDDNDEAMPPINDSVTPSQGISSHDTLPPLEVLLLQLTPGPAERMLSESDRKLLFMTPGRPALGEKRKQMDEEEAATQANTHATFVSAAPTKFNKRHRKKMSWRIGARTKGSNEARSLSRQLAFRARQEDSKRVRCTAIDFLRGCLRSRNDLIGLLIAPAGKSDAEVTVTQKVTHVTNAQFERVRLQALSVANYYCVMNSDHPTKTVHECADEAAERSGCHTPGSTAYSWAREVDPLNFRFIILLLVLSIINELLS